MSYNYTMLGRLCVTFAINTRFESDRHDGWFVNFAMIFMFKLVEAFLQVNMVAAYYFTMLIHQSVTSVNLILFYNSTFFSKYPYYDLGTGLDFSLTVII